MNVSIVMNKINVYFNSAFYSKNDGGNERLIDHLVIETLIYHVMSQLFKKLR